MEVYAKTLNIEALTMLEMARKDIFPAVSAYIRDLSETALQKKALLPSVDMELETSLISRLSKLSSEMYRLSEGLEKDLRGVRLASDCKALAEYYRDVILPDMDALREAADEIEILTGEDYWPYPTYSELLFHV